MTRAILALLPSITALYRLEGPPRTERAHGLSDPARNSMRIAPLRPRLPASVVSERLTVATPPPPSLSAPPSSLASPPSVMPLGCGNTSHQGSAEGVEVDADATTACVGALSGFKADFGFINIHTPNPATATVALTPTIMPMFPPRFLTG